VEGSQEVVEKAEGEVQVDHFETIDIGVKKCDHR
jgi:hypothetical protein